MKQIDYDYSLLDIEESSSSPLNKEEKDEVSEYQTSHSKPEEHENPEETPVKESNPKDDEDLQNRAKIFRTF